MLDPEIAGFLTCLPQNNETFVLVPHDILAYQWSSCLNLKQYWTQVKDQLGVVKYNIADQVNQFEEMVGLSLENDILPAIGDEFGGYLTHVDTAGIFPLPSVVVFLEVNNRVVIDKLFGLTSGLPMLKFQQETYSDVLLNYVDVPLGIDLSPSYAYVGDYLMFSLHRKMIKAAIDVKEKASPSIVENAKFQRIDLELTDRSINVQFSDISKMMHEFKGVAEWYEGWMRDKDNNQAQPQLDVDQQLIKAGVRVSENTKSVAKLKDKSQELEDQLQSLETQLEQIPGYKVELKKLSVQLIDEERSASQISGGDNLSASQSRFNQLEGQIRNLELQEEQVDYLKYQLEAMPAKIVEKEEDLGRLRIRSIRIIHDQH